MVESEARAESDKQSLEKKITKEKEISQKKVAKLFQKKFSLCLMVYSLGQREVRYQLYQAKTGIPNQLGKLTNRPTLRWIFQCFQGIHLFVYQGIKQVVNLTKERLSTLKFFPLSCQKYYILSG